MYPSSPLDLDSMRNVDVRTIDPATLIDIRDTEVNPNKPLPERMADHINQIRNPYCYIYGDMIIKISYANTTTSLEERMEGYFRSL